MSVKNASYVNLDIVKTYYKDIAKHKLLNKKQELFYGKLIKRAEIAKNSLKARGNNIDSDNKRRLERIVKRGKEARDKLIVCNLRLVAKYAKKYEGQGLPLLDLIQEGNNGLIKAVEKFDYKAGNRFSTYATYWIKQSLGRAVQRYSKNITMPYHKAEDLLKIRRVENELCVKLNRKPTCKEIAQEANFKQDYVEKMLALNIDTKSLFDAVDNNDEDSRGILETVADKTAEDPSEVLDKKELSKEILALLETLNAQENKVIKWRYGIGNNDPLTLEQIGEKLSVSRERVRQIQNKALNKLRKPATSGHLLDYLAS